MPLPVGRRGKRQACIRHNYYRRRSDREGDSKTEAVLRTVQHCSLISNNQPNRNIDVGMKTSWCEEEEGKKTLLTS